MTVLTLLFLEVPPEELPEGSLPVVGSAQNFSHKILIPQGCLTKNFSPIG